jgi:hypothetical protein
LGNYDQWAHTKEEFMRKSRQRPLTLLLFGIRASHWLAIPWFVFGLFGCALWSKSLPPYALSNSETTIVERDILSATKDLDKPPFHDLKAAKSSGGDLYVCGWTNSNNKAYRSSEQAFIGTFSAGRFSPARIGTDADSNVQVVVECQKLGISIAHPSWDTGAPVGWSSNRKKGHGR